MKFLINIFLTVSVLVASTSASNANLIINGGFEDSNVNNNQWRWFTADNVNGWSGSTIEVWDNLQNFSSYEGSQHAELNAHNNGGNVFSIFQTFATNIGASYDLSFAYAARTANNEQFNYTVGSGFDILASETIRNTLVKEWTLFETSFVATDTTSSIMFTSVIPRTSTVGNFLDDVNVALIDSGDLSSTNVSAPAGIAMVLAGLFAIVFIRKQR